MYDQPVRQRALTLLAEGRSLRSVSDITGVSRSAIRDWRQRIDPLRRGTACPRCAAEPRLPDEPEAYVYLLGLYLGDGCLSAQSGRDVHALRIACAEAWPGLVESCRTAITKVRPANKVCLVRQQGCVMVTSYARHWPCYFPQHGPGKKHERPITLQPWQRTLVDAHPWELLRGLIHSDGCRITNWATRTVGGERKRYEYPRYFFTNASEDILRLCTDTFDRVGVEWKRSRHGRKTHNVSVARRASVALMDLHIGPKH
ncbi:helix-turn-helix domain-containing protein [Streptomyces sp. NPDC003077]|uniref:helix-turn-helix domain-containing protein n=1 Tax=Streptomyces sp. NPDC003077 TaxID=3154443 RepID=UPI0033A3E207